MAKKKKKKDTELAVIDSEYAIIRDGGRAAALMKENLGTMSLSVNDLDKVKMPTGGAVKWCVATLAGEDYVENLEGIPIALMDTRRYWEKAMGDDDSDSPPDCTSSDGMTGVGKPGGDCNACLMNQFGPDKEPKPCQQRKVFFLIRKDDLMPLMVDLSPASLGPCKKFLARMAGSGIAYWQSVISISLEKMKNNKNQDYSRAVFKMTERLDEETLEQIRKIKADFDSLLNVRT